MEKVSRNDPCPCGSGKKFKKCCENQSKKRAFQVLSPETRMNAIRSSIFNNFSTKKDISPAD